MADKDDKANIVHYGRRRCRRVARSVRAAEIHALVSAFDFALFIANLLAETIGRTPTIEAVVESRTLFDVVSKDGITSELRLQIDVFAPKESYRKGEWRKL